MDGIRCLVGESGDTNDYHSSKGDESTTDVPYVDDSYKNIESIQFPNGKKK